MRRGLLLALGGAALLGAPHGHAADHLDGPAAKMSPAADITDVYAWMSPDATKVNLVMNVFPLADAESRFSDQLYYVFHLNSSDALGEPQMERTILCAFDAAQTIECWAGDDPNEYVRGDASMEAGLTSPSRRFTVFAGIRNDPFFFNLEGFNRAVELVREAAPNLRTDDAGCPRLTAATSQSLVTQLRRNPMGGPAADFFAGLEVLSIVVEIDKELVTPGGPILGVWGSTNMRQ